MNNKIVILSKYFLLGIFFSFAGWTWETLLFLFKSKEFVDRGLLYFPICPIYGFSIISTYLLIGTPNEKRGIFKNIKSNSLFNIFYICLIFLLPTLFEYFIGLILDKFFNLTLWTYESQRFNLNGYICLSVSVLWGIFLYLIMRFLYKGLKDLFFKINNIYTLTNSLIFYCYFKRFAN